MKRLIIIAFLLRAAPLLAQSYKILPHVSAADEAVVYLHNYSGATRTVHTLWQLAGWKSTDVGGYSTVTVPLEYGDWAVFADDNVDMYMLFTGSTFYADYMNSQFIKTGGSNVGVAIANPYSTTFILIIQVSRNGIPVGARVMFLDAGTVVLGFLPDLVPSVGTWYGDELVEIDVTGPVGVLSAICADGVCSQL